MFFKRKNLIQVRETSAAEMLVAFRQLQDTFHERIRVMEVAVRELTEDLGALQAKHERLRGRVYGAGLHQAPETAQPVGRDAIRKLAGIVPGRPYQHKD